MFAVFRRVLALGAVILAGAVASAALVGQSACSSAKPLGDGQRCFQAIECAAGLACVPDPMVPDASRCSSDLSGTVNITADAGSPMEGGMMMDAAGMDTGVMMDSGGGGG